VTKSAKLKRVERRDTVAGHLSRPPVRSCADHGVADLATVRSYTGAEPPYARGDRVLWNGGAGTFSHYELDGAGTLVGALYWDQDVNGPRPDGRYWDEAEPAGTIVASFLQTDSLDQIDPHRPLRPGDVAVAALEDGPFGHIVQPDGTVWTLTEQYSHGILLAMLYPEKAAEHHYPPPVPGAHWTDYQSFEIGHGDELPTIRHSRGAVSMGRGCPVTPAQVGAVRRILASCYRRGDKVTAGVGLWGGEMTAAALVRKLEQRSLGAADPYDD
jgi:hypothetical protein